MRWLRQGKKARAATVTVGAIFASSFAAAQVPFGQMPEEMQGVDVTQRLNEQLPLDLEFINEKNETITLGDLFPGDRPIILTLNYYTCPQLCHLTLNEMLISLNSLDWTIGDEFDVITVTINPDETYEDAAAFKRAYVQRYNRQEGAEAGWHFLTGEEENIKSLADAVGFGYRFDPRSGEYAHPSSIQFITPDGRISKYMVGMIFPERDVRFSLLEASEGTIGSPLDRFLLLTCFQYDPDAGSYVASAWKIMRTGGALTVLLLAVGIIALLVRGSIHQRRHDNTSEPSRPRDGAADQSTVTTHTHPHASGGVQT